MPYITKPQKRTKAESHTNDTVDPIITYNKKSRKILKKVVHLLQEIASQPQPRSMLIRKLSLLEDELIKAMISLSIAETMCQADKNNTDSITLENLPLKQIGAPDLTITCR